MNMNEGRGYVHMNASNYRTRREHQSPWIGVTGSCEAPPSPTLCGHMESSLGSLSARAACTLNP